MNTNKEIIDDNLWAKKCGDPVQPHTLHTPKSTTAKEQIKQEIGQGLETLFAKRQQHTRWDWHSMK